MANWKTTVKLGDLHRAHQDGTITIQEVAKGLADRLSKNFYAEDLQDEIEALREVADVEEYDEILAGVYDFGDFGHRIWIETIKF